jgi:hypothetical protein
VIPAALRRAPTTEPGPGRRGGPGLLGLALGLAIDAEVAEVILPFSAVLFVLAVLRPAPVLADGAVTARGRRESAGPPPPEVGFTPLRARRRDTKLVGVPPAPTPRRRR